MNIKDIYFYMNNIKEQIDASLNMKTEFTFSIKKDNSMDLISFIFFDKKRYEFRRNFSLTFLKTLHNSLSKQIIEDIIYMASKNLYEKMYNK